VLTERDAMPWREEGPRDFGASGRMMKPMLRVPLVCRSLRSCRLEEAAAEAVA
jgi:hypothetical protein